jgi:hypothetical protein
MSGVMSHFSNSTVAEDEGAVELFILLGICYSFCHFFIPVGPHPPNGYNPPLRGGFWSLCFRCLLFCSLLCFLFFSFRTSCNVIFCNFVCIAIMKSKFIALRNCKNTRLRVF